ncbi:MAG: FeoA domain-containing protein [Candidatus Aminicenantales bacterium]
MINLLLAPQAVPLKLVDIVGGERVRRRLFTLGFHAGDIIERSAQGILRGPVLIKNIESGVTVAIGRSVAQKIMVEAVHG